MGTGTPAAEMRRHAWNTDFEWSDHEGPFTRLAAEQVAAFDRDGFIVLDDLLDDDLLASVIAEIDRIDEQTEAFLKALDGERLHIAEAGAITFSPHLVVQSGLLRSLTLDHRITGIVADLCGPDSRLYWDQAVYKKPDKPRRFPWHQDNGYTFVAPQQYLTVWLALTDATEQNGCPWVVPGLHRSGTLAHTMIEPLGFECFADHPDATPAPVSAGGAVVFSSLTPHLTGSNTTDEVRKAYIVQYAPDGARLLSGDPEAGPPTGEALAADPKRQYPVVQDGRLLDA